MRTSKIVHNLIALIFWLAVWEIAARALNLGFAFPTI